MLSPFGLENKKILITGASSGIGRQISISCSFQSASVMLVGRNIEKLNETKMLLQKGDHLSWQTDITIENQIDKLVEELPILDGIVLNAGIVKTIPIRYIKKEDMENIFSTNIQSSIMLIQKLLKVKKIKNGASICFISSVSTQKATIGNSLYIASKGAVNAFSKALALELAPKKIRVNAILPGFVETNIMSESSINEEQLTKHKNNYPLGRFGKPEDIANLAIYLLADASEWMTGSLITIDGGFSLK